MMPGDRYDYLEAPALLTSEAYPQVEKLVLGNPLMNNREWEQPAGSCIMGWNGQLPPPLTPAHSTSLRQQLHQVVTWPGTLHESLEGRPPDAFVFIRSAGVALRHTLDGFYDKLHGGSGFVRRGGQRRPPLALIPTETFKYQTWNIDAEADRLKNKLGNSIGHICLIDNDARFHNDTDLVLAASVAHAAGAQVVSALRTVLYERIDPRDVNIGKMQVAPHAKFMSRLGKLCCNLEYSPNGLAAAED